MGLTAALAPGFAPAPAARAPTAARPPPVLHVRQTARLLQRACDCGATAGLSGRCVECDRVSLQPGRVGDHGQTAFQAPDHAPSGLVPTGAPVAQAAGHDLGRLSIRPAEGPRVTGTLATGRPVRVTSPVRVQAQLHVSSPSDPAEQEAQAMGKLIARMADPISIATYQPIQQAGTITAQRQAAPPITSTADGPPTVYRRETGPMTAAPDVLTNLQGSSSTGTSLPRDILSFMEPRFGADFSSVRIHTGEHAALLCGQLSARAFTIGRDIYFGKDQFRPDAAHGWELIAHELTHTIQQGSAPRVPARPVPVAGPPRAAALARAGPPTPEAAPARVAEPLPAPPPTRVIAPVPAPPPARVVTPAPAAAPARVAAPMAAPAATRAAAPAPVAAPARVAERAPASIQRLGISDALNFFADKANLIPGFRMLTLVLGVNPINLSPVDRSAANVLRALIELIPGGGIITQALQNSGVFEKAGAWVSDQIATLKMTGQALKQAVTTFLGTLSWTDIFDLAGVWERAKRIFTEPIDRLIAFGKGLVEGILKFIKDAILLPLAKLAEGTSGWDLLIAVLGKNPITGEQVPRTPEKLIGGFLKLIHQDEIWDNMQKSNAIPRAWAWFQGAMNAVVAFVSQIPDLFIAAFKSLTIEDVVLVAGAFQKVGSVFGGFLVKFTDWAGTAIWNLLEIIFDVVSPGALMYVKKTGAAIKSIFKNPLPFVGNLVKAAKLGLQNFADHFGTHLKTGLIDWLTGSLPGVYIPTAFSLVEFGKFALSVLGITWGQIRGKIVKVLGPTGEKIMAGLETTFDVVVALVKGGPAAAWELIKEKLTDLKDTVIDGLIGFVTDTIITKAIPKLVSLFIPGAGFISAILSIYGTVKAFIERLSAIAAAVTAFIDSIVAIAEGQIEGAAKKVESALAGVLSLAIGLLAGFLNLGNISSKIMGVIGKVRAVVDKAIDAAIAWIVGKAKALFAKLFGGGKDDKSGASGPIDPFKAPVQLAGAGHEISLQMVGGQPQVFMASGSRAILIQTISRVLGSSDPAVQAKLKTDGLRQTLSDIQSQVKALETFYHVHLEELTLQNEAHSPATVQQVKTLEGGLVQVLRELGTKYGIKDLSDIGHSSKYVVNNEVLPQYQGKIRETFYNVSWDGTANSFKASEMTRLNKLALDNQPSLKLLPLPEQTKYYWSEDSTGTVTPPAVVNIGDKNGSPELDHVDPLGNRWEKTGTPVPGNDTIQANRTKDYLDPKKLQVLAKWMNIKKGGETFTSKVGPSFRGPDE